MARESDAHTERKLAVAALGFRCGTCPNYDGIDNLSNGREGCVCCRIRAVQGQFWTPFAETQKCTEPLAIAA